MIIMFLDRCFASESFLTEPEIFLTPPQINNNNDTKLSQIHIYKSLIILNDKYIKLLINSNILDRKDTRNFLKQYRFFKRKAK